jgi:uncharacterized membrane protein (Fun14 family)
VATVDFTALAVSALGGFSMGYAVGWALRKVVVVVEYVAALVLLLFGGAAMLGIITVHLDVAAYWLAWLAQRVFGSVTADAVVGVMTSLGAPFLLGFALGFSRDRAPLLSAAALEESEWVE